MLEPFPIVAAVLAGDLIIGDPQYRWHPVRVIGSDLIGRLERRLRGGRYDTRAGGVLLVVIVVAAVLAVTTGVLIALWSWLPWVGWIVYIAVAVHLLAFRNLVEHGVAVARASEKGDLEAARFGASMLVGRDTDRMGFADCNRAAIESLCENLTDSVIAPLFWMALFGLPGLVLFRVVNTGDAMIGYRTPVHERIGWFTARADDVMAWIPARLSLFLVAGAAAILPGMSARRAWTVGVTQHAVVPGPNSGWSEASAAGALGLRLVGDVWEGGVKVVDGTWIGDPSATSDATPADVWRTVRLLSAALAILVVLLWVLLGPLSMGWWPEMAVAP